jgi:hypothetical protein
MWMHQIARDAEIMGGGLAALGTHGWQVCADRVAWVRWIPTAEGLAGNRGTAANGPYLTR